MLNLENNCVLKMKNLYFEKITFERDTELPTEIRTSFKTDFKFEGNDIEVKLTCAIKSNTKVALELTLVGMFEIEEQDETLREEISKVNTVSIMFPYLRAELSLITAQPNFPTIDLPIVNINELLKANGEIVGEIDKK